LKLLLLLLLPLACSTPPIEPPARKAASDPPRDLPKDAGAETGPSPSSLFPLARALFADRSDVDDLVSRCGAEARCLFEERYKPDARALEIAHGLFVRHGIVSGVEAAHVMDGGYRGRIRIVPAVPGGPSLKHLAWVADAFDDIDAFFTQFGSAAYRYKPLEVRFMRSVAARTPSAYAVDWTIAWNLDGSLHTSGDAVRETLIHEIFHLNDARENGSWSDAALGPTFDVIVKRCGTATSCLAPYSPNDTIVRGGTYYSFQPGNGVREYAAELALRYVREQRAILRKLPRPKPFKCGPKENVTAWNAMRDTFFGGVDHVAACGSRQPIDPP
jgi:hypothetical protein